MYTIWIVDKDPILGVLLEGRLKAFGFSVRVIADAIEALSALESSRPDLILTELSWPTYSPTDWVIAVYQKAPQTKCVAVTDMDDPVTLVRVFEEGVCDYVVKPFDFRTLLDKVQSLCKSNVSHR